MYILISLYEPNRCSFIKFNFIDLRSISTRIINLAWEKSLCLECQQCWQNKIAPCRKTPHKYVHVPASSDFFSDFFFSFRNVYV